jgi:hypothetical protein
MDKAAVAAALCEMPAYLREHPHTSLKVRLEEILALRTDPVTEADLLRILSARQDLIESWTAYVENQRTADGWYVAVADQPPRRWILSRPGHRHRIAFESKAAAYAALVLRIMAPGLLGSQSGAIQRGSG